jgi:hypothetical protein
MHSPETAFRIASLRCASFRAVPRAGSAGDPLADFPPSVAVPVLS